MSRDKGRRRHCSGAPAWHLHLGHCSAVHFGHFGSADVTEEHHGLTQFDLARENMFKSVKAKQKTAAEEMAAAVEPIAAALMDAEWEVSDPGAFTRTAPPLGPGRGGSRRGRE